MRNKKIICHECNEEIMNKRDLSVVGNAFLTYHNECFKKIKHSNIYAFHSGYKLNGFFLLFLFVILNSAIWSMYFFFSTPIKEVLIFSGFISVMLIFYRVGSYLAFERYLK